MRLLFSLALVLCSQPLFATPPKLEFPNEVRPDGQYAVIVPTTDAVSVIYIGLDGVEPIPPQFLSDKRSFLLDCFGKQPGLYRFVAVGASSSGEQARKSFTLVIPAQNTPEPPKNPPTKPPVDPPKDPPQNPPAKPPVNPSVKVWVVIAVPEGPVDPALAKKLKGDAWVALDAKATVVQRPMSQMPPTWKAVFGSTQAPAFFIGLETVNNGVKEIVVKAQPKAFASVEEITKLVEGASNE